MPTTQTIEAASSILATMDEDKRLFNLSCRAITFTDRVIIGGKDNYRKVTDGQPVDDQLSMESFNHLNDYYYAFKVSHDLRHVLEVFIILECHSYTTTAKNALFYLPKIRETGNEHADQLLSLVNANVHEEFGHLDIAQHGILKEVIRYGAFLEKIQHDTYAQREPYSENVMRILLAACISLFAASGDGDVFGGNPRLTESAHSSLHTHIMKRHNPVMAAQIYALIRNS